MFDMKVVSKSTGSSEKISYSKRRKHIRKIIFDSENDITLTKVSKWIGKESRTQYKYVQQVMKGYAGKKSTNILDKIENELRKRGYYEYP